MNHPMPDGRMVAAVATRETQGGVVRREVDQSLEHAHKIRELANNLRGQVLGENVGHHEDTPEPTEDKATEPSGLMEELATKAEVTNDVLRKTAQILEQIASEV